tara:strand:- start:286 stop:471 length:186 start_codon:yes stop_codon:yes gene_type:complete
MSIKLTAKDTYVMVKTIYPGDDTSIDVDTLIDAECYYLRKEYGKKYGESCGEVIVEYQTDD